MNTEGFITLDRRILDWRWYRNSVVKDVFIHLLLCASFKDHDWEDKTLKRGQCFLTAARAASDLGITEKQFRLALDKLEKAGSITKKSEKNRGTLVTVINYDLYQNRADRGQSENRIDTMVSSVSDTSAGQTEGRPMADRRKTEGKPREMTEQRKQRKQCKQGKEYIYAHFDAFWSVYPRKVGKHKAQQAFEKLNVDDALMDTILKAVEMQKKTWSDPQFIPHPTTWLNQHRWEDEVEAVPEIERTYDIHGWDDLTFENEVTGI